MDSKISKLFPLFLLALVTSTMVSCAFREDDVEKEKRENTQKVIEVLQEQSEKGELTKENVSYSFLPEEIGKYRLILKWPSSIPKVKIQVNDVVKGILSRSEGYEFIVASGSLTRVVLTAMNDLGNEISMLPLQIEAPDDLVIDSVYYPEARELQYARIRITENGTIITGKSKLLIVTSVLQLDPKNIVSDQGVLQSAHIMTYENIQDMRSEHESTPGTVEIKVLKQASGQLLINSIGLDGKDGLDGEDAIDTSKGSRNGADANISASFIAGGKGPDRNSPPQCRVKENSKAQKGKDGIAGSNGQDGMNGSDSQLFIVNVQGDYEDFSVHMLSRPGKGGSGGRKGNSIPAGIGGVIRKVVDCKVVDSGRAENGIEAQDALDGKSGSYGNALGLNSNLPQYKTRVEEYTH